MLFPGCLLSLQHVPVSQRRICSSGLRVATLRKKLQIKLSVSPSNSILTPGQPVPVQAPGRVVPGVPIFRSLVSLDPEISQAGIEPRIFRSRGGRLNHYANEAVRRERELVGEGGRGRGGGGV